MRDDVERLLDMIEMCDLLLAHASEPGALRSDPVVQGAAQIGTWTILAHGYFHVDQDIIGSIVSDEIPEVRRHLAAVVESLR